MASVVKNLPANAEAPGDASSVPGLGRSHGVGNGNPLQYSCLENSMDRGDWQATVHGVIKSRAQPSAMRTHTHTHSPHWKAHPSFCTTQAWVLLAKLWCECAWPTEMALAKLRGAWGPGGLPAKWYICSFPERGEETERQALRFLSSLFLFPSCWTLGGIDQPLGIKTFKVAGNFHN